jgi:hypothetical protein
MRVGAALFAASVVLGLPCVGLPPTQRPAAAAEELGTIDKAKALLRKKGFDPTQFPKKAFDPKKSDPLLVMATWSNVRPELEALLLTELQAKESKEKPRKPTLELHLVPQDKEKKTYRFVFQQQRPAVKQILKEVLGLDDAAFADFKVYFKTISVRTQAFLPKFLKEGAVDFPAVEEALVNFVRTGDLKDVRMEAKRKEGQYLFVQSAWRKTRGEQPENGSYYVRLRQGLSRHPRDDAWLLFAYFEIVFLPKSENDPDKFSILIGMSDKKPEWANRLTLQITKTPKTEVRPVGLAISTDKSTPPEMGAVYKVSPLATLSQEILDQTRLTLCGKPSNK